MKKSRTRVHLDRIAPRFDLKIKIALFFLITGFFQVMANSDYSIHTKISLNLNEATLLEVIKEIEDKTEFTFFYKNEDINLNRKLTIKIIQKPVLAILDLIFKNEGMLYEVMNKHIIIRPQETQITGKVIDKYSGEAIPYCNITLGSSSIGTSSNELGEFIITVDSLPVNLIFSHINYGKYSVEVSRISGVVIALASLTNHLQGVTVSASKKDRYALELARKAYRKANQNSNVNHYGKAFYRQKSKNDQAYSEFSEIIYDIRYNNRGIEDWEILEGRYALKTNGLHNKNYTLLSRLLTPLQPVTDELIFPMHPELETYYDVRVIDYIASENDKIAVLWFKPLENSGIPTFEAEVYINTQTYDILKIVGNLSHDNLKLVKLSEKNSSWKNYKISYEIAYRQDTILHSAIDYINIDQGFDYYKNDSLKFHASSTSNLTFFEQYYPTSRKKLGGQFRKNKSDWQKLDEIGYNEKFWNENPIVKRTPVEEEVIAAFEKNEAFGSIFLNSRNQVVLMQSAIINDPFIKELESSVNLYNNYNPVEKIYLHTDKDIFASGETIWYSGYVVLGSFHYFSEASKVLHVDLIGPTNEIISSQTQEILNGKAIGSIKLPENLASGNYQLRSYTDWMRNFNPDFFFTKMIKVLNEKNTLPLSIENEDKIDLQFFPEGGYAVANLIGQVAFKAIGSDGLPRKVQGQILNSQGRSIATLRTIDRGAGFFSFNPQSREKYTAVLKDGSEYPLPQIIDQGYAITINNVSPKSISVKVQASELLKEKTFYIIGHVNNKKYYQGKFVFGGKSTINFEIPKNKMPSGIMTLTLFDKNKKTWCERVVFINNQEELVIHAKTNTKKFEKRNLIAIDVHVTDTDGRPVSTELSIAVTDAEQVTKNPVSGNILTHLLLQSDLKGHINNPGLLFKNQKRATLHALDLVMLTHGWRKLPWQEIQKHSYPPKEFPFSKGLTISGIARGLNRKPLANTALNVIAKSETDIGMFSAITSDDGTFLISDFNFKDNTEIVFNALNSAKRAIDVKVSLDADKTIVPLPRFISILFKDTEETKEYSNFSDARKNMHFLYDLAKTTELDEVVVTKKNIVKIGNASPSVYGQTSDATLYTADNIGIHTVLNLVRLFGGVTVSGNRVSIRNGGTPLWVLDGLPVFNENPSPSGIQRANTVKGERPAPLTMAQAIAPGPVPSFIANMDTFSVERIEILKGASAAIYGSRGGNGVILIYTKRGGNRTVAPTLSPDFTIMGHAAERAFYSPKYNIKPDRDTTPDYRATLYWNPSFTTDKNGNARLIFYNSDNAQQIQVAIEGLSNYGIPGAYLKTFGEGD